jgi:hypothetical protein
MFAIIARAAVVLVALAGLGALVWRALEPAPGGEPAASAAEMANAMADGTLVDAAGNPVEGGGAFAPVPGMGGGDANHMVRYEMPEAKERPPLPQGVVELAWSDLWAEGQTVIPAGGERVGTPDRSLFPEGSTEKDISDFFLDIGDMRSLQPRVGAIRRELDGRRVRLAGYTTPVGFGEFETRFLLVPELGACIHVPPPPPNQILYVERARETPEMFAAVWVTGTLRADPVATILADVGYRLEDVTTEPYE